MPPFMQVQSLYASCLEMVFDSIYEAVQISSSDSIELWRKIVQSDLHSGIREHLLQIATMYCRRNVYTLLDLLGVLLDKTTRKLDHSRGNDDAWLPVEQCAAFFSRLDQCSATGLQELTIKVRLHPRGMSELEVVSRANPLFHRVLRNGLASSLHSLVLCSACDNETLRLLGRHSQNLRHLDVTSSWLVDDNGLRQLCFKDPELYAPPAYSEHAEGVMRTYLTLESNALNRCCETLQQVRIQDTNTSEVGVLMLLLFIPNLKSLGGFIYYRNVGDAILSLQSAKPDLQLNLTDLWDTCLPPDKAAQLSRAVPHVTSLYTRGNYLPTVNLFCALSALTIDFDFCDFRYELHELLLQHGARLKKLVIVDQNHPLDISLLAELCPNLMELGAKLEGSWNQAGQLTHLTSCRVRVGSREPFTSLLVNAPRLSHFEVSLEEESYGQEIDMFLDSVMFQALCEADPPLECLTTFLMNSECYFGVHTVELLMSRCPNLRLIGDLELWAGVTEKDVQDLACEVRRRNLDLTLRYRGNWPAGRNSIQQILQECQ
ncbi:uncharacterized protein [Anabrus simplex]|uniref:uncharacterized protein n=1 Tax=Anabrus simplex TaxID=316456 RepID=UPI0034DCFF57